MSVFIDTNVFFAAAVPDDAHHDRAGTLLSALSDDEQLTTDHVLIETWNLLARRRDRAGAMRFWSALRHAPVKVECVTPVDLERAHAIAESWSQHAFDIVDCTSFAVMERLGCYRAATFDDDFAVFRTGSDRTRAFEIVR